MIKAVIFDFGNVISLVEDKKFFEAISHHANKSKEELEQLVNQSGIQRQYERGAIQTYEFIGKVMKLCDLSMSKTEFAQVYISRFKPMPETRRVINSLESNYKLGLISNTSELDFQSVIKKADVYTLFNSVSLSFKVKAMKPDEKIYRDALSQLKLAPKECAYIDDIKEYADAATSFGMHGIQYTSHTNLIRSLKNLGIKIN